MISHHLAECLLSAKSIAAVLLWGEVEVGDDDFLNELINSYFVQAEELLNSAQKAADENDLTKLKFHIHSLKGISYNVGACAVGDLATAVEVKVAGKTTCDSATLLCDIKEAFVKTCSELTKAIG